MQKSSTLSINDFPHVEHKVLRQFLEYWMDLSREGTLPTRKNFDPLEIPEILPNIWICEFELPAQRFLYRLIGEDVRRAYDQPVASHYLDEITDVDAYPRVHEYFVKCVKSPAIIHVGGTLYSEREEKGTGERLMLPCASEAGDVKFIFGATITDFDHSYSRAMHESVKQIRTYTPIDGTPSYCTKISF